MNRTATTPKTVWASGWFAWLLLVAGSLSVQGSSQVTLAWEPGSGDGLAGYHLYYGTNEDQYTDTITTGIQTNIVVSNLVAGVTYYFVVTAFDALGAESDPSNEISFSVPQIQPAGSVQETAQQITGFTMLGDGSARLSWTSVPQASYLVWYKNDLRENRWTVASGGLVATGPTTSWIDTSAAGKTKRFYRVSSAQ
jgi:hypothetical protein